MPIDKNGTEIKVGDTVRWFDHEGNEHKAKVIKCYQDADFIAVDLGVGSNLTFNSELSEKI